MVAISVMPSRRAQLGSDVVALADYADAIEHVVVDQVGPLVPARLVVEMLGQAV